MPGSQGQWEGAEGFKIGNPKRHLDLVTLAQLSTSGAAPESGTITQYLQLNGLTGNLKLDVGVTFLDPTSNLPLDAPGTNAITLQIYPYKNVDGRKIFARPVFQDPTATDNQNNPLPQACPFIWEGPFTEADGLLLEVIYDLKEFAGFNKTVQVVAEATVEYNGSWWDVKAFTFALANVQWAGAPDAVKIFNGGE